MTKTDENGEKIDVTLDNYRDENGNVDIAKLQEETNNFITDMINDIDLMIKEIDNNNTFGYLGAEGEAEYENLTDLRESIDSLGEKINGFIESYNGLIEEKKALESEIEKVKQENEEIKQENEEIKKENEEIKKENEEIKKEYEDSIVGGAENTGGQQGSSPSQDSTNTGEAEDEDDQSSSSNQNAGGNHTVTDGELGRG